MDVQTALQHIGRVRAPGTLITLMDDGTPHASVVFAVPIDDSLWISSTQTRVKTRNVRRDSRAVFQLGSGPWVAVEGTARLREGDGALEDLRRYYRAAAGEHPDWDDYDRAMVAEQRLVIELAPRRAYGEGL